MKQPARILVRISLIILGVFAPLIILEIAVRVLGLAPPPIPNPTIWGVHPELGWWHIPNSGGTFYSDFNEFTTEVSVNALGLRDDLNLTSYDIPDKTKILILADSFSEALQVPLEQTFFRQLQEKLIDNGQPTQTINAGVGSWGTDQEATYFRLEGHKFNPDLTLLFFFARNDVTNNHAPLEIARNGGSIQKSFYTLSPEGNLIHPSPFDPDHAYDNANRPPSLPPAPFTEAADWLWLNSHLYRWMVPYMRDIPPIVKTIGPSGILGGEGRIRATHPSIPVPFYVYQTPMGAEWRNGWALTEAILADLRVQVEAQGGKLAVVMIPAREQVYQDEWQRTLANNADMAALQWNLDQPNQLLSQILTRLNIPYLDLLPAFRATASQEDTARLYFVHDGHWTKAGHALAADSIFEFVEVENLIE